MDSGILLIRKKEGMTSYDIIRKLKKVLNTNKIGHAGSLDPFAEGLIIIGVNEGTKLLQFLEEDKKEYLGRLEFGKKTDTGDKTGKVIETKPHNILDKFQVLDILNSFLGDYIQTPPKYSAIKINGKPSYEYARENKEITLKPVNRKIYKINLIELDDKSLTFFVCCSKGTYIRTLGEDIASKLNEVGHLTNLRRISIGKFHIRESHYLENITTKDIIPLIDSLNYKKVEYEDINKIKNGCPIKLDNINDKRIMITNNKRLLAIYDYNDSTLMYHCKRGFNDGNL